MSKIDKLLGKISKAKSSFKSLKGSLSDLSSALGVVDTDTLGQRSEQLRGDLESRRKDLQSKADEMRGKTKENRQNGLTINELTFPFSNDDEIDNWIVFRILPRVAFKITDAEEKLSQQNDETLNATEIRLYVPDGLKSDSAVAYGKDNFGVLKRELQKIFSGGEIDAGAILSKAGSSIKRQLMGGKIKDMIQGRAVNPMDEVLLDGLDFREFTFNYDFNPTSKEEAIEVGKIINTFRRATLPNTRDFNVDTKNVAEGKNLHFYNYPNKFQVSFEGPIQNHVDGFLTMVCKNVEVNHDGGQKLSTFYTGQPVRTTVTLTFQEIVVLTQQNYDNISAINNSARTYNDEEFGVRNTDYDPPAGTPESGGNG